MHDKHDKVPDEASKWYPYSDLILKDRTPEILLSVPPLSQSSGCCLLQATFLFSVVNWHPLTLVKGLVAPAWATALGWFLACSSVSLLPIWAIYALSTTPGTLTQVTPAPLYTHIL